MLIDTHAHLTMPELAGELPGVLERAAAAGVSAIVCVGIDLESSGEAVELARRHPAVAATVGVHPNDSERLPPGWLDSLRSLARSPGVVAIGETGLDYYRNRASKERQREALLDQLGLAGETGLPVVIHSREASGDVSTILREWSVGLPPKHPRGVLHCFSGDRKMMEECCAAGFYVSFAGPVTYAKAGKTADMVRLAPRDRLLLETDSPFLAPHPHRGKRNEPAFVRLVAERVAELRGEGAAELIEATGRNAARLFRYWGLSGAPVRRGEGPLADGDTGSPEEGESGPLGSRLHREEQD